MHQSQKLSDSKNNLIIDVLAANRDGRAVVMFSVNVFVFLLMFCCQFFYLTDRHVSRLAKIVNTLSKFFGEQHKNAYLRMKWKISSTLLLTDKLTFWHVLTYGWASLTWMEDDEITYLKNFQMCTINQLYVLENFNLKLHWDSHNFQIVL